MPTESVVKFRTLDGLHLAGTLASPDQPGDRAVLLVHGGGVTREEGSSQRSTDWWRSKAASTASPSTRTRST